MMKILAVALAVLWIAPAVGDLRSVAFGLWLFVMIAILSELCKAEGSEY